MKNINLLPPKDSSEQDKSSPKTSRKRALILFAGLFILLAATLISVQYFNFSTLNRQQTSNANINIAPSVEKPPEAKKEITKSETEEKIETEHITVPSDSSLTSPLVPITLPTSNPVTVQKGKETEIKAKENIAPVQDNSLINKNKTSQLENTNLISNAKKEEIFPLEQREYYLLIGSYSSYNEAKDILQKLNSEGFEAYQEIIGIGQTVYQVYVEGKTDFESAKKMENALKRDGFETYLAQNDKKNGSDNKKEFSVRTGVFNRKKNAETLLKRLEKKGYKGSIIESQMQMPKYEIKTSKFQTYQAAKEEQNKLKSKGYDAILLLSAQ